MKISGSGYGVAFRPDLQGLRAIAVLLVILAHAGVSAFSGEFSGVDIFFVVSGYLITGLLVPSWSGKGELQRTSVVTREKSSPAAAPPFSSDI